MLIQQNSTNISPSFDTNQSSTLMVGDETNISRKLSSINDPIVFDQILSSITTSLSLSSSPLSSSYTSMSSSSTIIPLMMNNDGINVNNTDSNNSNDDNNNDNNSPLSTLWTTRILTMNDDIVCSQLFTANSANIDGVSSYINNDNVTIMANVTNTTLSSNVVNLNLDQLSEQLNNQSQLFLNETWIFNNYNNLSSENDYNASSSSSLSSSITSMIMNQNLSSSLSISSSSHCETVWDGFYCWPMTASSTILMRSCRDIFDSVGELPKDQIDESTLNNAFAYRICDNNGSWINNWTNYTECLLLIANNESDNDISKYQFIRQLVILIMFSCSMLSLILLLITFFIFTYFRSLTSCRFRVHRNLVLSLILHSLCLLLIASPHLFNPDESLSSYWEIEWLCKSILTLKLYSTLTSINWMFIEGFQLHSRVTVSILRKDAPFKFYHLLGWGIPLVLITIWALQMSYTMDTLCWNGYAHSFYIWIIVGPMILALSVNCIFLVNIIRVLLTKLRLTVTIEIKQIRKAIKATALLFPLLGISHLLFCINPDDNGRLEDAYLIFNAFLQSSQGIFVAILYCFMDSDVQQALKLVYQRTLNKNNSFLPPPSTATSSRWSRMNTKNHAKWMTIMNQRKLPLTHKNNLGSFKYSRRQPMYKNIIRTNSLNNATLDAIHSTINDNNENDFIDQNNFHQNLSNNDNCEQQQQKNKHFEQSSLVLLSPKTNKSKLLMNYSNVSKQQQHFTGTGKIQQLPITSKRSSSSHALCIMYNSNGEMVRFKPKLQHNSSKNIG